DFRPLSNDGHWQEAIPVGSSPLCAATDPAADFRWHALQCGGPEVAAFICELPVPTWASGSRGCLLTELPSLTVLYVPEQSAIELTSDCGLDGTKRIACKGNADRDEMMRQLSCGITNDDYDDKTTKGPIPASTIAEITNPSVSPNIKTTKPWIWTSNTIDTGDYGAPTRHRRETENTLGPATSTRGTTDLTMRERSASHQEITTKPSVFIKQTNSHEKLVSEAATVSTLNDVTLDLSITQRSDKSPEITATPVHDSTTQESSSQPEEQAETFAIATPTADSKSGDVGQEDTGEYPGVINQGQLFSIIENGTMFDIIELNENGTEETSIGRDSVSTLPQDNKRISFPAESTTQHTQTVKNLYTTVIYHKEPPEDLTDMKDPQEREKQPKQEVTPTFKIYESKTSFNDKNFNKQKTINDLLTKEDDRTLTKEVEIFPIVSDSSIKLNRTYRKKLPMIESNLTKENDDILIKTDEIPATQQENSLSEVDDFVISDENSAHKVVEIKLHKDGNKNSTRTKLIITTKVSDKSKRGEKNSKVVNNNNNKKVNKNENQKLVNVTQKEAIEKFDDPSNNNTDMETEVKGSEIDPRIDTLNAKGVNSTKNNDSEIITPITSSVERVEQADLKKQFLPKPLLEESEKIEDKTDKSQEVVMEEPQETVSTMINPTGEPLEPIPQQQPRPNRQRLLTKPQRRSFYPYFFSRVLG
ncbi:hypothetical protein ILUMI_21420, partial [Ignelater luminosus]